jgi:hypothetical protein
VKRYINSPHTPLQKQTFSLYQRICLNAHIHIHTLVTNQRWSVVHAHLHTHTFTHTIPSLSPHTHALSHTHTSAHDHSHTQIFCLASMDTTTNTPLMQKHPRNAVERHQEVGSTTQRDTRQAQTRCWLWRSCKA